MTLAVALIEDHLWVNFTRKLVPTLRICTTNVTALDALEGLMGRRRRVYTRPGTEGRQWQCAREEDIRGLLTAVLPYLCRRALLARLVLAYLDADNPERIWLLMQKIHHEQDRLKREG